VIHLKVWYAEPLVVLSWSCPENSWCDKWLTFLNMMHRVVFWTGTSTENSSYVPQREEITDAACTLYDRGRSSVTASEDG
jgi:hypothetical protein